MAENVAFGAASSTALLEGFGLPTVEQQILDFLDGRNDGTAVLDALYGDTLDELLPPRLTDLLRNWHRA